MEVKVKVNNNMKKEELLKRVKELEEFGIDTSDFLVQIEKITVWNKAEPKQEEKPERKELSKREKMIVAEYYRYLSSNYESFEEWFRAAHTNNAAIKNLRKYLQYRSEFRFDEDRGFVELKRHFFNNEFIANVLEIDVAQFANHCDKNHYREFDKCFVKCYAKRIEYPTEFAEIAKELHDYIAEIRKNHYFRYTKNELNEYLWKRPSFKGRVPYNLISRIKAFYAYVAYRDWICEKYLLPSQREQKLAELNIHMEQLLEKKEEYKIWFEFEEIRKINS